MPAVHPRARVRLRAIAVAFTVSSSLIVGIASAPAHASSPAGTAAAPTAAAASISLAAAGTPAFTFEAVAATKHKTTAKPAKKVVPKKSAAKKVVKHRVTKKHKVTKKKAAPKLAFGSRVIRVASTYRGTPYQYGATGPRRFDCSGFTRYIFAKFGISLPHSSSAQYSEVRHIANKNKRIGDLVFFHSGSGHVYHVGIYAGGDEIWAATHTGDYVRLEGMWNASYYVGRV